MGEEFRLYLATVNDEGMCVHAKAVAEGMLGLLNVRVSAQIMAAEDFGFYAEKINAAFSSSPVLASHSVQVEVILVPGGIKYVSGLSFFDVMCPVFEGLLNEIIEGRRCSFLN
jgi:metal-dependent amidase/aminoacylase/carboxypeptidase family protein